MFGGAGGYDEYGGAEFGGSDGVLSMMGQEVGGELWQCDEVVDEPPSMSL